MRGVLLLLALGLAGAQSPRWAGDPEYRTFPGAPTAAGPTLDKSYALVYPAQGEFRGTVLFVPGFLGGATNFDALARRLVLAAPGWEVWAWDRRSNGLEDRRGFATADPWAYYRRYQLPEFPFLKDWGLQVHLDDLERLVEQARARGPVVLAGHSLGASLAALFALYCENLAGLILLDGSPNLIRVSQEQYRSGGSSQFGRTPGLDELLSGKAPPYITLFGLDPMGFAQAEAQAFMAAQAPQADAPPGWAPWRASRIAAALYRVDDRYQPFPVFSVSLGRAVGREGFNLLGFFFNNLTYTVRGPRGNRVEWQDTGEATDPLEFLRLYANPTTGFSEWFFPYRLTLDIGAWEVAVPQLKPRTLPYPVLALGAGRGLLPGPENFAGLSSVFPGSSFDVRILPGLTHLDLLTGRNGPAVGPITQYLQAVRP
ncbi:MAG TPA: alpha/beta fold hydrolase [Meiothermus sp.]|nr:alpha/beta fold hydrolase [Meiothermus sp.]